MLNLLRRRTDPRDQLREFLGDYELPSLPAEVIELLRLLRTPETPVSELARHVERDPQISVRILRLVNSAGFGLFSQVSNILHAVALLGRSRLESLVLTVAAVDRLPRSEDGIYAPRFWAAAARRACVARAFATELHAATQAEAFTAGLLLDMGIPVLARAWDGPYHELLERWEDGDDPLVELERHTFGVDHAEVGGLIAREWGLPGYLVEAIRGHHDADPDTGADPGIRLAGLLRYGDTPPELEADTDRVVAVAGEAYGIDPEATRDLVAGALANAEDFAQLFRHA